MPGKRLALCTKRFFQPFCYFACPSADLRAADVKEPFGMDKTVAPETSSTWQEWKKVIAAADIEIQKLEKCRAEQNCNLAENKYSAIVKEARPKEPYPKVDFVQVRINHEIQYVPVRSGGKWTAGPCRLTARAKAP